MPNFDKRLEQHLHSHALTLCKVWKKFIRVRFFTFAFRLEKRQHLFLYTLLWRGYQHAGNIEQCLRPHCLHNYYGGTSLLELNIECDAATTTSLDWYVQDAAFERVCVN